MELSTIYMYIREYGYIAFFLLFAIGLFIFPVPNEVLLMAGGYLATYSFLTPLTAFITIFLAIIFHGSFLYFLGHKTSLNMNHIASSKQKWRKKAQKGNELLEKYGLKTAAFSYFFPFVRHAVPFAIGLSKYKYINFFFISFSSALVWMSIYFFLGFYYGRTINDWTSFVEQLILTLVVLACLVIMALVLKERLKKASWKNKMKKNRT
ncbi:hypothetical protein AZF04_00540 [Alkalihalobacillus trypoxylicola]|uniref:VTT domain-containing protein n=2 Tax=Alkalihalobacillus trypoxylicola TaxID=519424 RepID=A0A161PKQ3_9BACI|nr:hypothetical protein AZF04_00540 [Alkalihalobacillus trypoxylicola]